MSGPTGSTCDPTPDFSTGKQRDPESNLDDFGARYFSSQWGHWMSPDWAASAEAIPYAKLDNPQTFNLYAYVSNDPIDGEDPDGHAEYPSGNGLTDVENQQMGTIFWSQQTPASNGGVTLFQAAEGVFLATPNSFSEDSSAEQQSTQDPTIPTSVEAPPPSLIDRLFPQTTGDTINLAVTVGTEGLGELAGAAARVLELAAEMGKTADYATIAVTERKEGVSIVSSSEARGLRPAVQAALKPGEVGVKGIGHAETTGISAAKQMGLTPTGVAASRGICPSCADFLRTAGVAALSALKGIGIF